jgi:hypothetical protein
MIWFPLILTIAAAIHLGSALYRFDLNDWALALAGPTWGFVLLAVWGFRLIEKVFG